MASFFGAVFDYEIRKFRNTNLSRTSESTRNYFLQLKQYRPIKMFVTDFYSMEILFKRNGEFWLIFISENVEN